VLRGLVPLAILPTCSTDETYSAISSQLAYIKLPLWTSHDCRKMRQSNVARDQWRILCRERLSAHIQTTLGITVKPSEVRLNPGPNDPYAWSVLPEKRGIFSEIFSRNLSQHSINAYKTLCEGVASALKSSLCKMKTQGWERK